MTNLYHPAKPRPQGLFFIWALAALAFGLLASPALAKEPLAKGQSIPDLELYMPSQPGQAAYLGLKQEEGKTFRLSQIRQPWLLIEVFNMYCTICQGEAKQVNQLYGKISQGPLKDKLAIIGIGAGNSPFEVEVFRKRYDVEFPLFHDRSFKSHKALGEPRTPYFMLVRKDKPELKIVFTNLGPIGEVSNFLDDLQQALNQN